MIEDRIAQVIIAERRIGDVTTWMNIDAHASVAACRVPSDAAGSSSAKFRKTITQHFNACIGRTTHFFSHSQSRRSRSVLMDNLPKGETICLTGVNGDLANAHNVVNYALYPHYDSEIVRLLRTLMAHDHLQDRIEPVTRPDAR